MEITREQLVHELASFITDNEQIKMSFLQVMELKGFEKPHTVEELDKLKLPQ
jgi:hypothetical protein